MNALGIRLTQAQHRLGLKKKVLAAQLRITPEWYSKIVNGAAEGSTDIGLRLDDLLRRRGIELTSTPLKVGGKVSAVVEAPTARHEPVASRIPERRSPSTRQDCAEYFERYLNAAEGDGDPDNFPSIMKRLRDTFDQDEWENAKPADE